MDSFKKIVNSYIFSDDGNESVSLSVLIIDNFVFALSLIVFQSHCVTLSVGSCKSPLYKCMIIT